MDLPDACTTEQTCRNERDKAKHNPLTSGELLSN